MTLPVLPTPGEERGGSLTAGRWAPAGRGMDGEPQGKGQVLDAVKWYRKRGSEVLLRGRAFMLRGQWV